MKIKAGVVHKLALFGYIVGIYACGLIPVQQAYAEVTEGQFRSVLGFMVSAGIPIAEIKLQLGETRSFQSGEFEEAICYYQKQAQITLISMVGDGGDSSDHPDTFDMYEITQKTQDTEKFCSELSSKTPDAAFQPDGLSLGMNIDQFKVLTGATANDEMPNGVKSARVFQKFFSSDHYVYAYFDKNSLISFRVQ